MYLLDTNVVAELTTKPRPDERVLAWFDFVAIPDCYLSVLTIAEIEEGIDAARDPVRKAAYADVLAQLRVDFHGRIVALGESEAKAYLSIHNNLKRLGQTIDPPDALIAATAAANDWILASRNVKHLARTGAHVINPWEYLP